MKSKKYLVDEDVRKLVLARLGTLSSDTMISFGSDGQFTPAELAERVSAGDDIGEKLAQMQMEWLRHYKVEVLGLL